MDGGSGVCKVCCLKNACFLLAKKAKPRQSVFRHVWFVKYGRRCCAVPVALCAVLCWWIVRRCLSLAAAQFDGRQLTTIWGRSVVEQLELAWQASLLPLGGISAPRHGSLVSLGLLGNAWRCTLKRRLLAPKLGACNPHEPGHTDRIPLHTAVTAQNPLPML